MTSRKKRKCPECGALKLVRIIGPGAGVIFKKGCGGFYSKDYPKDEEKNK
jgi:predicted nucleic acid-binding Zn ribbon protein